MSQNNKWVPIESVLDIIKNPKWEWYKNTRCKYINVRIDTRDGHCFIEDRDGKEIDLKTLKFQYGK